MLMPQATRSPRRNRKHCSSNTASSSRRSASTRKRQSIAGINLDEQTQNLIKYQTAYQAAAKTISTLSQLLDTIVTGLGVGS
jgi:flagellar hook-associated protein 1 FlgK